MKRLLIFLLALSGAVMAENQVSPMSRAKFDSLMHNKDTAAAPIYEPMPYVDSSKHQVAHEGGDTIEFHPNNSTGKIDSLLEHSLDLPDSSGVLKLYSIHQRFIQKDSVLSPEDRQFYDRQAHPDRWYVVRLDTTGWRRDTIWLHAGYSIVGESDLDTVWVAICDTTWGEKQPVYLTPRQTEDLQWLLDNFDSFFSRIGR